MNTDRTAAIATPEKTALLRDSWCRFDHDARIQQWIDKTLAIARNCVDDPANAQWHRCGGTWFAGVNVLPNDETGSVEGGVALTGKAVDFIHQQLGHAAFGWDRAQVSVIYPGYPQPMQGETDAAYRYRLRRDAAHIDGITHQGPKRRRFLGEQHAFVLGIPMVQTDRQAAPLVVWQGSHQIVRESLQRFYADKPPEDWPSIDVTDHYHALRREIFDRCERVQIWLQPGETYLVHRLALHGMSPWPSKEDGNRDTVQNENHPERMICYFRPAFLSPQQWLQLE